VLVVQILTFMDISTFNVRTDFHIVQTRLEFITHASSFYAGSVLLSWISHLLMAFNVSKSSSPCSNTKLSYSLKIIL
jgi:hypothetical protein